MLAHTANEVIDFYNYLQYKLEKRLEYLGYYDQNMDDIKIQFKDTIIKYSFLEDIINDVCPRILNTQTEEQKQESIYIVTEKVNNEMTIQEIRGISEIHKFENRLSSSSVPFNCNEKELYNPVTQKVEDRRFFRLLDQDDLYGTEFFGFYTLEIAYDPETQKAKYEQVLHKNDLYKKGKMTKRRKRDNKSNKSGETRSSK